VVAVHVPEVGEQGIGLRRIAGAQGNAEPAQVLGLVHDDLTGLTIDHDNHVSTLWRNLCASQRRS
jgi:hypothetical protein